MRYHTIQRPILQEENIKTFAFGVQGQFCGQGKTLKINKERKPTTTT